MKKLISILMLFVIVMSVFCTNPVFAADDDKKDVTSSDVASSIIDRINPDPNDGILGENEKILDIAGKIIGAIQFVSIIAAVILVAVFGFQFIMGSAEEKKDYQKKFIPLIIGIVVVFAATTIARILFSTLVIK